MPFEARKNMTWGPGPRPIPVKAGDEVSGPVKLVLIQLKHVVEVEKVSGRTWAELVQERLAEDPEYAQYLGPDLMPPAPETLHKTRLVGTGSDHEPADKRAPKVEAVAPSPPEVPPTQEGAGESTSSDEPAPPPVVKKRRGRPRKSSK